MQEELRARIEQIGKDLQQGKAKVEEYRAMGDVILQSVCTCFDKAAGELIGLLAEEAVKKPSQEPFDTKPLEDLGYRGASPEGGPEAGCGCK